ncbi:MAG: lipase maturation factor family protein [Actinomycetota bacterium]|nr:lipase maturation factor family protein [Actinomycetota bacterium]
MDWFAAPDHWWSRLIFQRGLAAVYLVAFLVTLNQFRALIGENGLTPVPRFLARTSGRRHPSVFRLHYSDRFLAAVALVGAVLSAATVAGLTDLLPTVPGMLVWLLLWAAYLSIVNVGQVWYGFGWETLLLEAGFLAVFLGNDDVAPPLPVLWLTAWLLFRVEFGAGLIKMRGDRCWRDLTCLDYHHETQPMPGPLSRFFHSRPRWVHRAETAANHVTQLVVPFGLFLPQPVATVAGAVVLVTQAWLVISGNFSWLNALTMLLAVPVLDLSGLLGDGPAAPVPVWFAVAGIAVTALVVALSVRPVLNMISGRQLMNASFEPLRLVNAYGAFGSVTRTRYEIIIEGTRDTTPGPETAWHEYGFRGKPGDPARRPPQVAPYHLRLDWLMWFAALSPSMAEPWFRRFVDRLLEADRRTLSLLRHDPFDGDRPAWVRARLFHYRFADDREHAATGDVWVRSPVSQFLSPVAARDR